MDDRTRDFLAGTLRGCQRLSKCKSPEAALISRGEDILSFAYTVEIIPNKGIISSPIIDAIVKATKIVKYNSLEGLSLFSSYFPKAEDMKLIHSFSIKNIFFFGELTDTRSVKFLNAHTDYCSIKKREDLKFSITKLI